MRTSLAAAFLGVVLAGCSGSASPTPSANETGMRARSPRRPPAVATAPAPIASPTSEPNVGALVGASRDHGGPDHRPESAFDGAPGLFVTVSNTEIGFRRRDPLMRSTPEPAALSTSPYRVVIGPLGIVAVARRIVAADNSTIGPTPSFFCPRTVEPGSESRTRRSRTVRCRWPRDPAGVRGIRQDFGGHAAMWTSPMAGMASRHERVRPEGGPRGFVAHPGRRALVASSARPEMSINPPRIRVWRTEAGPSGNAWDGWRGRRRRCWRSRRRTLDRGRLHAHVDIDRRRELERRAHSPGRRRQRHHGRRGVCRGLHRRRRQRQPPRRDLRWKRAVGRPHVDVCRRSGLGRAPQVRTRPP